MILNQLPNHKFLIMLKYVTIIYNNHKNLKIMNDNFQNISEKHNN